MRKLNRELIQDYFQCMRESWDFNFYLERRLNEILTLYWVDISFRIYISYAQFNKVWTMNQIIISDLIYILWIFSNTRYFEWERCNFFIYRKASSYTSLSIAQFMYIKLLMDNNSTYKTFTQNVHFKTKLITARILKSTTILRAIN